MAQHGVPPGDDETFLHEVLLGHIRYAKLLRVFVDEFYGQNSGTLLRGDATLYGILALLTLLRLEEMGFAAFRKFVMSQDPQKMIVFLQYTFDVPELRKLLWGEWTRLYDRERVRALFTSLEQFLAPIGEIVSVLEEKVFLQKKKEEEEANAWASEGAATYTTAVPFQLSESRPRIIRVHTAPTTSPVRAKPIPKSLYRSTKEVLAGLERQRTGSAVGAARPPAPPSPRGGGDPGAAGGGDADAAAPLPRGVRTAPSTSFAKGTLTSSSTRHADCVPPDADFAPFQATAMPHRPRHAAPVRLNKALVQREEQRIEAQRRTARAKQRRFEQEKRDSSTFDAWRKEMLSNDEEQRLEEIQRRREEMAHTAELSAAAHQHMLENRMARAGKFKAEEQALLRTLEADVRAMRSHKKGQHDAVLRWEGESRRRKEEHQRQKNARAGSIRSWRDAGRQTVERDRGGVLEGKRRQAEGVRRAREEAIQHIMETYRGTATQQEAAVGMLGEMTEGELKEQLALARELRRVREQDTRKGAQISKNRQAAALLGGARSVGELRSGALPATPRGAASTAGGGGPAPRMAWSRTQKYLSPQQGLGGGANQGTTPRGDGRAGGGEGKSKEKARSAKTEVEVKRFRSLRAGAQRELRQRQAQSQQETLMHERIRVAEDRERHLHLQQQRSRREKENRRFFEELKRRGLEQTMQATRDREARRAQAQAQRSAMRNSAAVR